MSIIPRQLSFAGGGPINKPENPGIPGSYCGLRCISDLRPIAELPEHYRSIFQDYAAFNIVQSKTLDDVLYTDASVVVSAPTGSGKTGVFELAIVRMLMALENTPFLDLFKIVYLSPMKALCEERLIDWNRRFQKFNINCISVTGDSDFIEFQHLLNHNLIITTPEKWDSLTRRWKDNQKLVQVIKLFMIDEVHLLNEETRGSTLEAVVCRMKTIQDSLACSETNEDIAKYKVRFVAVSATVANVEDIAEWIAKPPNVKHFRFSDDTRPVKLKKIVLGYHYDPKSTWFRFDLMLNYKLQSLLMQHADGKPTLIFCSTRKIAEMTAMHIVQHLTICLKPEQKERLIGVAKTLSDLKVREILANGVGYHHAGMLPHNRHAIENLFRSGDLPVLVTTRTLAMGVNLPAHLVIIKSTKVYDGGEYRDYTETAISQMIGRAGRPQFDTSATALILTTSKDKEKYERMVGGTEPVESNLHRHLTEHLNAEVVLHTITDLDVALKWLSSTFLYIRARKNPKHYGLSVGMTSEEIDRRLLDMAKIYINKLVKAGMLTISGEQQLLTPTKTGQLMAKYCLAFETFKLFTQIKGDEILQQIVGLISKCSEFSDMFLRAHDKKCLNLLNKNKTGETIRFPLTGKIKTLDMKINCVIQAILGCLDIGNHSILTETLRIMRYSERIITCLIEYLETRKNCYNALLNSVIMAKCIRTKLWENSPHICKQFGGIGIVMSSQLVKAGKTTLQAISSITGREIEFILNKKPPMGSNILDQVLHLPKYALTLQIVDKQSFQLIVTLENASELTKKCTANIKSCMYLIAGDSFNNVLHYEKITHSRMISSPETVRFLDVSGEFERLEAHLISEDWVGFDCYAFYVDEKRSQQAKTRKKSRKATSTATSGNYMETFLQMYQKQCDKEANEQPAKPEQQSEQADVDQNATDNGDNVGAIENPMSSGKTDNDDEEEQFWNDEEIDAFLKNLDKGMENLDGGGDDDYGKRQALLDKAYDEIWGKDGKEDKIYKAGPLTQMKKQLDDFVDFDDLCKTPRPSEQKTPKPSEKQASKEEDYWKELEMQYNNLKTGWHRIPSCEEEQNEIAMSHFMCDTNQDDFQVIGSDSDWIDEQSLDPKRSLQHRFDDDDVLGQQIWRIKDHPRRYSSTATNNQPIVEVGGSNINRLEALAKRDSLDGRFGRSNVFEEQIWGPNEIEPKILGRSTASDLCYDRTERSDEQGFNNLSNLHDNWEPSLIHATTPKKPQIANGLGISRQLDDSKTSDDLSKSGRPEALAEITGEENFDDNMSTFKENSKAKVIDLTRWSNEDSSRSTVSKSEKSDPSEERNVSKRYDQSISLAPTSKEWRVNQSFEQNRAVADQILRDKRDINKENITESDRSELIIGPIQDQMAERKQGFEENFFEEQDWRSVPNDCDRNRQFKSNLSKDGRSKIPGERTENDGFDDEMSMFEENSKAKVIDLTRWSNGTSSSSSRKSEQFDQRDELNKKNASKGYDQSVSAASTSKEGRIDRDVDRENAITDHDLKGESKDESKSLGGFIQDQRAAGNRQGATQSALKRNFFEEQIWGLVPQAESSSKRLSDVEHLERSASRCKLGLGKESDRFKNKFAPDQRNETNSRCANQNVVKPNVFDGQVWESVRQGESSLKQWSNEENFGSDALRDEIGPSKASGRLKSSKNGSTQDQKGETNSRSMNQSVAKRNVSEEEKWRSVRQDDSRLKRWSDEENFGSNALRNEIGLSKVESRSKSSKNGSNQDQMDERNSRGVNRRVVERNTFGEEIWGSRCQGESNLKRWSDGEKLGNNKSDALNEKMDLSKENESKSTSNGLDDQWDKKNAAGSRPAGERSGANDKSVAKRNFFEEGIWGCIQQKGSNLETKWSDEEYRDSNKSDLQRNLNKSEPLIEVYDQGANRRSEDRIGQVMGQQNEQRKSNQDQMDESQESFYSIQKRSESEMKRCHVRKQTKPKRTQKRQLCFTDINAVVKDTSPIQTAMPSSIALMNCKKFKYTPRKKLSSSGSKSANEEAAESQKLNLEVSPYERREENPNRKITWRSPLVFSPDVMHTPKLVKKNEISPQTVPSSVDDYYSHVMSSYRDSPTKLSVKDNSQCCSSSTLVKTQTTAAKSQTSKMKPNTKPLPLPLSDMDYKDRSRDDSRDNTNELDGSLNRTNMSEQLRRSQGETPPYSSELSLNDFYSQILRKYDTPRPQPTRRTMSPPPESLSKTPKIPQSKLLPLSDLYCNKNNGASTSLERKTLHTQDSYYSEMMKNYQQNLERNADRRAKSMSSGNDAATTSGSCNDRHSPLESFESFRSGLRAMRTEQPFDCSQFSPLDGLRTESNGVTEDSGVNSEMPSRPLTEPLSPIANQRSSAYDYPAGLRDEHFDSNELGWSRRFGHETGRQRTTQYERPFSPLHESGSRGVTDDSGVSSAMLRRPPLSPMGSFLSRESPYVRRDHGPNPSRDPASYGDRYGYENSRRFGYEIGIGELPPVHHSRHSQLEPFSQASRYDPRRYEPYPYREVYRPSYDVPYRDYDCYRPQRYNAPPPPPPLSYQSRPVSVSYRPRPMEQELMLPIGQNYMLRRYFNSMDEMGGEEEANDDEFFCF